MVVRVKICGIRDESGLHAAVEAGADAVGFVFAPSPRQIEPAAAAGLVAMLPPFVTAVAVMRRPAPGFAELALQHSGAVVLQTDAEDFAAIDVPPHCRRLPVLREGAVDRELQPPPDFVYEGAESGRGQTVDWALAAAIARRGRMTLAGGLDAGNVGEAIRRVRPFAVDVSSGVEASPGQKDPARIRDFIAAVRAAEQE